MFVSLLTSAVLVAAAGNRDNDALAFVARYYKQGKERSYNQFYVSDLRGKRVRQITFGKRNYNDVRWLDRSHAVLTSYDDRPMSLWLVDIKKKHIQRMNTSGCGTYFRLYTDPAIGRKSCFLSVSDRYLTVSCQGLRKRSLAKSYDYVIEPDEGDRLETDIEHLGFPCSVVVSLAKTSHGVQYKAIFKAFGKEYRLPFYYGEGYIRMYPSARPKHSWLWSYSGGGSIGEEEFLYDVDWAKGTSRCVINKARDISVDVRSRYWSALSDGRDMAHLKDGRSVWVCSGLAGDFATGKRWTVVSGLVMVSSIDLAPDLR